jgi:nucleoside-diphosphate-sugar epimerase
VRIVITGASGNVGTALLRRLRGAGHDLVGICRRPPRPEPPYDVATWHRVDLADEAADRALADVVDGATAVVHLAWGFQPSHDLRYLEELGVGGTRRVLAAVTATGVPHLVHMSSIGAYSPKRDDTPVDESWPTGGVRTSRYSVHKAAAERLLDAFEADRADAVVTRMRPGIVGQRAAGSALLRYGLPAVVPAAVIDHVPVVPLDKRLVVPMVHADDVADAIARAVDRIVGGAFNLAADPPITTEVIADQLGARAVHVPSGVLRPLMSLTWHARLQQVDTGWLDMAFAVPLLDTSRARSELGWRPRMDAVTVLAEVLSGMRSGASAPTAVLRPRTVAGALRDLVTRGPVGQRDRP